MIITVFYSWILAYTFHLCFLLTFLFHVVSSCLVSLSRPSDQTTGLPMPSPSSVACRIAWPHCQPDWSRAWRVSTFHGPFSRNTPQTVSLCIFTGSSLGNLLIERTQDLPFWWLRWKGSHKRAVHLGYSRGFSALHVHRTNCVQDYNW